jgi:ligand-binding sensor domain-containing protein
MVHTLCRDSKGGMWFGSYTLPDGAVSYFHNGQWTYYSSENGLPNNNITAFFEDGNVMWIGTGFLDKGGACRMSYNDDHWIIDKTLTKETGLAGDKVCSIFKDSLGSMWFGSEMDGITVIRDDESIILKEGLSNPEVKAIHQDVDGNLWLGSQKGITIINYEALKSMIPAESGTT